MEEERSESCRSEAKICIMRSRCSNEAGLGALSAFWIARRRRRRFGAGEWWESWRRAEVAIRRCARVGGLKEELLPSLSQYWSAEVSRILELETSSDEWV